jgi:hypothetical protein
MIVGGVVGEPLKVVEFLNMAGVGRNCNNTRFFNLRDMYQWAFNHNISKTTIFLLPFRA